MIPDRVCKISITPNWFKPSLLILLHCRIRFFHTNDRLMGGLPSSMCSPSLKINDSSGSIHHHILCMIYPYIRIYIYIYIRIYKHIYRSNTMLLVLEGLDMFQCNYWSSIPCLAESHEVGRKLAKLVASLGCRNVTTFAQRSNYPKMISLRFLCFFFKLSASQQWRHARISNVRLHQTTTHWRTW